MGTVLVIKSDVRCHDRQDCLAVRESVKDFGAGIRQLARLTRVSFWYNTKNVAYEK